MTKDEELAAAERLIANVIDDARRTGMKAAIPAGVRAAWDKVRHHIIHDGAMDDYRFDLEDFFDGVQR